VAVERVAAAVTAAHVDGDPLVLTARAENLIRGVDDLDDTITRLCAYADAGADCVYAPGLSTVEQIRTVVDAVSVPVNVLALPNGPTVDEIGEAGGRRISIGGALASTAYGALMLGARELLTTGTSTYLAIRLSPEDRAHLG
jgi:2-methylisocitrate lyase-like PEP mutase family enzyme